MVKITSDIYNDLIEIFETHREQGLTSGEVIDEVLSKLNIQVKREVKMDRPLLNEVIRGVNKFGTITRSKVGSSTVHVQEDASSLHFQDLLKDLNLQYPKSEGVFKEGSISIVFSDETGPKEKIYFFEDKYIGVRSMLNESEKR